MKAVHTIDHVVNTIFTLDCYDHAERHVSNCICTGSFQNCTFIYSMERGTFKISSDLEYIYGRSSVRSQRFPCWFLNFCSLLCRNADRKH